MTDVAGGDILDVAIVGGGVSGAYSAWRLSTTSGARPPKIALFEGSARIGGRLLSVIPPGIPQARVELGGMRYTTGHRYVQSLLHELGIISVPFPVHQPENILYLRGNMLRCQDATNPALLPYRLRPDECTPTALADGFTALAAQRSLRVILGKDADLATVDWNDVVTNGRYEGQRLRDLPLRYLLQRSVSDEALCFADDSTGYDTILTTWNAADGFPWNLGDFGRAVTYLHVENGYDTLPLTLVQRFQAVGGTVHLGHRLRSLDVVGQSNGSIAIALQFDGSAKPVLARRLILAMPRRALELLQRSGPLLADTEENRRVHELIRSVTPIPLFKLAICYPFPWWQTIDPVMVQSQPTRITKGESITDMPVRQCYYWAVDPSTQNAVVLVYDDGRALDYWAGLRERSSWPLFQEASPPGDGGGPGTEWANHAAPDIMVREAHRQLLEMHGVQNRCDIPLPCSAAYRDWSEDPYGGGVNYWHLHVDSWQVSQDILQPKPPLPVFICGEAYSHNQGWVEGALETAEQMLELHFGLERPSWLEAVSP